MKEEYILPLAFCEHYKKILGEKSELFFEACKKPLRKCIRVNTLKISVEKWKHEMDKQQWKYEEIEWCPEGFFIDRPQEDRIPLGKTLPHALGCMYSQEASSMLPAEILCTSFPEGYQQKKILDLAAAPGSKSTQIASKMRGDGLLLANELSGSRIKGLFSNLERCGVVNSILTHYDGSMLCAKFPEIFDGILLDAPCTGEGTVRKDYDALKNWKPENAVQMASLQKRLIAMAFESLKPGGVLVYSTCTLSEEENEGVIQFLLQSYTNATIVPLDTAFLNAKKSITREGFLRIFPEIYDTEGFFVAKIQKSFSASSPNNVFPQGRNGKFPFVPVLKREIPFLKEYFQNVWGYDFSEALLQKTLWKREKEIWLFPEGAEDIFPYLRCDRIGIPVCTLHDKEIRLRHEYAIAFGSQFLKGFLEVTEKEAYEIYEGKDLQTASFGNLEKREYVSRYEGIPIALGKYNGEKWKNSIPRGNVRRG